MNKPILEILGNQSVPCDEVMDTLRQIVNVSDSVPLCMVIVNAYNLGRIHTLQEMRAKKKGLICKTKQTKGRI